MTAVRQRSVALILARELAVNLATPMWVWDENGTLVYYNDHVAHLFGALHADLGIEQLAQLSRLQPVDLDGNPIRNDDLPSPVAIRERRPEHRELRITGLDGVSRTLTVTAFPLFARGGEFVGAMSVFWESDGSVGASR